MKKRPIPEKVNPTVWEAVAVRYEVKSLLQLWRSSLPI